MKAWCCQDLRQHLTSAQRLVLLDEEEIGQKAEKARKFGVELDVEGLRREVVSTVAYLARALGAERGLVHKALALAAYAHDVGKAIRGYQEELERAERVDRGRCPASLKGHEVWSAWAVYHVLSYCRQVGAGLAAAVAAGVLLHHSPRRPIGELLYADAKPGAGEVVVLGELLWEGLKAVGLCDEWAVEAGMSAMRNSLLSGSPRLDLVAKLQRPEATLGENVAYVISLVDGVDNALERGCGRITINSPLLRVIR